MLLETSEGERIKAPTQEELLLLMQGLGDSSDYCRLSNGKDFIQASITAGGLIICYRDKTGLYRSTKDQLKVQTAIILFNQFLDLRDDWKGLLSFEELSGSESRKYLKAMHNSINTELQRSGKSATSGKLKIF